MMFACSTCQASNGAQGYWHPLETMLCGSPIRGLSSDRGQRSWSFEYQALNIHATVLYFLPRTVQSSPLRNFTWGEAMNLKDPLVQMKSKSIWTGTAENAHSAAPFQSRMWSVRLLPYFQRFIGLFFGGVVYGGTMYAAYLLGEKAPANHTVSSRHGHFFLCSR